MSRYIDAELIKYQYLPITAIGDEFVTHSDINSIPTADVQELKHGYWTDGGYACGETCWTCSICGHEEWRSGKTPYCPFCGAKMDESEVE